MSDLLDVQVSMYPELLRRMAAGEHLASQQDDTEKLAAILLAAEAMEAEQAAEAPVEKKAVDLSTLLLVGLGAAATKAKPIMNKLLGNPAIPEEGSELIASFRKIIASQSEAEAAKRKLLMVGLGAAGAGALAVKALEGKKQDKAASDEAAEEKAEEKAKEKSDDKKSEKKDDDKSDKKLPPWLQGNGAKSDDKKSDEKSEKKDDEKSDDDKKKNEDEKDSSDVAVSNIESGKATEKTGSPSARAVLSRLMKSFA